MDAEASDVRTFIAYRREDVGRHCARLLWSDLAKRFGEANVFRDVNTLEQFVGESYEDVIEKTLDLSEVELVLIGDKWATGENGRRLRNETDLHRREIEGAVARGIEVIPVLVEGAKMPEHTPEFPATLAPILTLEAQGLADASWNHDVERLIQAIERLASKRRKAFETERLEREKAERAARDLVFVSEAEEAAQTEDFDRAGQAASLIQDRGRRVEVLVGIAKAQAEAGASRDAGATLDAARDVVPEIEEVKGRAQALALIQLEAEERPEEKGRDERRLIRNARHRARGGDFTKALEMAGSIADLTSRISVLVEIANVQGASGDVASAEITLDLARDAADAIDDDEKSEQAHEVIAAVEIGPASRPPLGVPDRDILDPSVDRRMAGPDDRHGLAVRGSFSAAEEIVGLSGTVRGDNSFATKEPGEPEHAGSAGGSSVWYRWTAPDAGSATFDTLESDFDTLLAVYRGSSLAELELVASNDDAEGTTRSQVRFPIVEGVEYMIAVDGYAGATGEIVLHWEYIPPPSNDSFSEAEEIVGPRGSISGDTTAATKEPDEPEHAGMTGGSSVWYRWTAPSGARGVTIDTFGSEFDTVLAVYRGSSLAELERVAANDDVEGTRQSRVRFPVVEGDEYRIAVDGYAGSSGPIVLNWEAREHQSLKECLDDAGLSYEEVGGGAVRIPFGGLTAGPVVVDATESSEGAAFFSVDLPAFSGFGKKGFLQTLLKVSYGADYVKAMSLPDDQFALAAEIPATALTPAVCEGLARSLAALGDVRAADLKNESGWATRLDKCKETQDFHIRIDPDEARRDASALLEGAGLLSFVPGRFDLDLGHETRPVVLLVSARVISLMVTLEGVRPGGDGAKLDRLLELNREVDIAKVGLDSNGDATLLYEVPLAVPDLAERAITQLRILHAGVRGAV